MSFIPPPGVPYPARRPDGFEIRRKKKVRPIKPGDL